MRNVWLLLRVQISAMLGFNKILHLPDRKERNKKLAGRIAIGVGLLFVLPAFGVYAYLMASAMQQMGQLHLFPVIVLAVGSVITLISSVSAASGTLLTFKDYEQTMSLPVTPRQVAASRLLLCHVFNVMLDLLTMLPCGVVYAILARPGFSFYPIFILTMLAAPVFPMIVGSLIGGVIARLTSSIRGAKYIQLLLGTAIMLAYMYGCFNLGNNMDAWIEEGMFGNIGVMLSGILSRFYPLANLYSSAVAELNWGAALLFLLANAALLGVAVWLLGITLRTLHTALTTTRSHGKFRMKTLKVSSPLGAFYRKEMGRYLSSTIYLFNTAFGLVLALVGAVILFIRGREILQPLRQALPFLGINDVVIAYALGYIGALMVGMSCTTSSSISLEGKNLWLVQSLPVAGWQVLLAKLLVNLTLTVPTSLVVGVGGGLALGLRPGLILAATLMALAYSLLSAALGLMLNLKMHNFEFTTDAVIVKQSAAVSLTVILGMILAVIPVVLSLAFEEQMTLIFWLTTVVALGLSAGILALFYRRGDRWIRAL